MLFSVFFSSVSWRLFLCLLCYFFSLIRRSICLVSNFFCLHRRRIRCFSDFISKPSEVFTALSDWFFANSEFAFASLASCSAWSAFVLACSAWVFACSAVATAFSYLFVLVPLYFCIICSLSSGRRFLFSLICSLNCVCCFSFCCLSRTLTSAPLDPLLSVLFPPVSVVPRSPRRYLFAQQQLLLFFSSPYLSFPTAKPPWVGCQVELVVVEFAEVNTSKPAPDTIVASDWYPTATYFGILAFTFASRPRATP